MDPMVNEQPMGDFWNPTWSKAKDSHRAQGKPNAFQVEFEISENFHLMQAFPWQSSDRPGMTA
jgi:hypothetical protein